MKFRSFIETYFDIDEPETGALVPFRFRPVQARYYDLLCQDYREGESFRGLREIILKARKEGFTSLILALFQADIITNEHPVRYLEISYKDDATSQHFRRAEGYVLSYFAKKTGVSDRKQLRKLVFDTYNEGHEFVLAHNGASFYVGTASSRTGERGGTVQGILFSEAAHYPDTGIISAAEIIEGTRNMVAVGSGMIFLETTANGFNHFQKTWQQASRGEVDYKPRFFSWRDFYSEAEFEQIKAGFTDKRLIAQEYPECVTGDTRVSAHGGIEVIGDTPAYRKGRNRVWRLTTSLGYQITATANHQFYMADGEWKRLGDIQVGDQVQLLPPTFGSKVESVAVDLGVPCMHHQVRVDEQFAEFLGVFMGDGSVSKERRGSSHTLSVVFDRQDRDSVRRIGGIAGRLFGQMHKRVTGTRKGCIELRRSNKFFGHLFGALEMTRRRESDGRIVRHVHVPRYIFRSPKPVVAAFLRGLFDADGFIGYAHPQVRFFTRYERFARDVQLLLLGFGITSRVSVQQKKAGDGHHYTGRELALRMAETERYMQEIGFISKRKQGRWRDRQVAEHYRKRRLEIAMIDTVASIEEAGTAEVYDMEVVPEHYYSGNGIWVHNSPEEAFLTSGESFFDVSALQAYMQQAKAPLQQGVVWT